MTQMITPDLVLLDADLGADKHETIRRLARVAADAGRTGEPETLIADAEAREAKSATGLPGGIAIPHCRTTAVEVPTLVFARLAPRVDFGAKDGPADLAFLIAAPEGGDASHLKILAQLARGLARTDFTDALRSVATPAEAVALIETVLPDSSPAPTASDPSASSSAATGATGATAATASRPADTSSAATAGASGTRRLVAVTACPTGIAHTYMAAEALEAAAKRAGVELAVETQGSAGSTPLSAQVIAAADAVIFAVDVGVRERARFAGKPLVSSGVKRPIDDADAMIAEAVRLADDPNPRRVEGASPDGETAEHGSEKESFGARTRRVLMTGVSYMIPFVSAGGLLIALGFLFGGYEIPNAAGRILSENTLFDTPDPAALGLDHALGGSGLAAYLGALLFALGATAFKFFVPALAGYIAYAIADRPGIAPGFVMGGLAIDIGGFGSDQAPIAQTGFLGAIVGGVLAGVIAHAIGSRRVPTWMRGLMPVLVIPLVTTLVAGLLMLLVFGRPIAALMEALTDGLNSMSGSSAILLGVILGLMMAFDMGGPLNKVAYAFATTGLAAAGTATDAPQLKVMAAVMLAGMVPPLALALATVLRPKLFTVPERENGKAAWLLGASFISEGAIPFAAADPLRVIPAIMLGSAVTGGLAEALDVSLRAPHGGIFVLFAVGNVLGFVISLAAGTVVGALAVVALKSMGRREDAAATV